MLTRTLSIIVLCLLISTYAWARPPSKIKAQYDSKKQVLMLDIYHLSRDNLNEYIKRVEVSKNSGSPTVKRQRQQVNPNIQYVDMNFQAEEGDILTITAYSSLGGSLTEELEITEELLETEIVPRTKRRRAISTSPSDKSKIRAAVPRRGSDVVKKAIPSDPDKYSKPHPRNSSKLRPAVPRDSSISKPAINPAVSTSAHPQDKSKYRPAAPGYNP